MRVLALDHGSARCGCAVSDPSGTLATPLAVVERPDNGPHSVAGAEPGRYSTPFDLIQPTPP